MHSKGLFDNLWKKNLNLVYTLDVPFIDDALIKIIS